MAKADLSDDVIKVGIWAILIGGVYLIYTTSRAGAPLITATQQTGAAVQKPFTWGAEGVESIWSEFLGGIKWGVKGGERRLNQAGDPERSVWRKDDNSWLWGWGPKKG